MPNFTPPESDLEEMPELPEVPAAQPTSPPATDLVPFTGHLVVLNPLLEEIAAYRATAGMGPQSLVFTPGTKPSVKREMMQERKMRGTRLRSDIVAIAKQTREDALRFQRDVIAAEKKLVKEVEEVEGPWAEAVAVIDREEQEEKNRRQAEIDARVRDRMAAMTTVNAQPDHPGMAVWHGESLATMAQATFDAHLTVARLAFEESERKRLEDAAELLRLQLDERLRTRTAELQAAEVTVLPPGLREMEEADYQRGLASARTAVQGRLYANRLEQERIANENRLAAEKIKKDRGSLRRDQLAAVGVAVPDSDFDELAGMEEAEFQATLTKHREAHARKQAADKLEAERRTAWAATPGSDLMPIPFGFVEMPPEEFQSWLDKAASAQAIVRLRADRTLIWGRTTGNTLITLLDDLGLITEDEFKALQAKANAAEQKRLDDLAATERDRLARLEALRPDKEKLHDFGIAVRAVPQPVLETEEGKKAFRILWGEINLALRSHLDVGNGVVLDPVSA